MYSHHIQHATNKTKTPAHLQVYPPTKPPLFSSQHLFRHRRGLRVPGDAFQISTLEAHDAMVKFGSMPQYLGCNHPLWGFTRRKQPLDFFIWKHNLGFLGGMVVVGEFSGEICDSMFFWSNLEQLADEKWNLEDDPFFFWGPVNYQGRAVNTSRVLW